MSNDLSGVLTPWSRLARGDLESVFAVYNGPIRNEVGRMLPREPELADEVAQQVRVRLLERAVKGGLGREHVRSRLRDVVRAACRNAVRDQLRALSARRRREVTPGDLPEADDAAWERDCRSAVTAAAGEAVRRVLEEAAGRGLRGASFRQVLEVLIDRADEDPDTSRAMADRLAELTGRDWRDDVYRRVLGQVRERVAEELVRRVGAELGEGATRDDLIDQLRRDRWLDYVRRYAPAALGVVP
jgi:hypothetical protein